MKWFAVFMSTLAFAQAPEFEVASIRPAAPSQDGRLHIHTSVWSAKGANPGRLEYDNMNLADVIGQAYGVPQNRIDGAGSFFPDRFDIHAVIPAGTAPDQVPLMLQALLADRFRVALHRETRQMPAYELTIGKNGPKLKSVESASGIHSDSDRTSLHVAAKTSMATFADFLGQRLGRPVLDETGLKGAFEFSFDCAPFSLEQAATDAGGPSIFTALQEQLGLKLESKRGPVEILVVDHAEKPSEN